MFKVLFAPFDGVRFERFGFAKEAPAVLVYMRPRGARVFICAEKGKEKTEIPAMEEVAEFLNCSPSFEFTWLMLHSIKDVWRADLKPEEKESDFMRTLLWKESLGMSERQPPFAPNNGERLDGY